MYFITGKITENEKELAYGLYDTNTQRAMIMSKKATRQLVSAENEVLGFERFFNVSQGKVYVRKNKEFMWKGLPELNGKGEPENVEDKKMQVLIGSNGFKEVKSYITVNSVGEVRIYTKADMKKELIEGNIIGAALASNEQVMTYVNEEISDEWILKLGYKRNEIGLWAKA